MKPLFVNAGQFSLTEDSKARTKKPASKEAMKAAVLFAGIYKSNKFTIDEAHSAFAGLARKK
jgi:hypothetical protein